jgi:hypothetical protein
MLHGSETVVLGEGNTRWLIADPELNLWHPVGLEQKKLGQVPPLLVRKILDQAVMCPVIQLGSLEYSICWRAVMFKLDITKDVFLLEVLAKLGFGERWLSMVCSLLSTTSTRVVVNGVAGNLIYNRRSLRQGDPLSSLVFAR